MSDLPSFKPRAADWRRALNGEALSAAQEATLCSLLTNIAHETDWHPEQLQRDFFIEFDIERVGALPARYFDEAVNWLSLLLEADSTVSAIAVRA